MRAILAVVLCLFIFPAISLGEYNGYRHGPYYSHSHYGSRPDYYSGHHHDDEWVVPLVIVGGLVGAMALSQMATQPPPPPPQRICRDTYDYYDEYGGYLYSRYVDRPCY